MRAACPALEQHWLGHGSCKRMLEALHLPSVQIVWHRLSGYAMGPQRHRFEPAPTGGLRVDGSTAGCGLSVVPSTGTVAGGLGEA